MQFGWCFKSSKVLFFGVFELFSWNAKSKRWMQFSFKQSKAKLPLGPWTDFVIWSKCQVREFEWVSEIGLCWLVRLAAELVSDKDRSLVCCWIFLLAWQGLWWWIDGQNARLGFVQWEFVARQGELESRLRMEMNEVGCFLCVLDLFWTKCKW